MYQQQLLTSAQRELCSGERQNLFGELALIDDIPSITLVGPLDGS